MGTGTSTSFDVPSGRRLLVDLLTGIGRKPFRSSRPGRRSSPALDPFDELYPSDNSLEYPSPAGPFFTLGGPGAAALLGEADLLRMAASDCPPSRLLLHEQ